MIHLNKIQHVRAKLFLFWNVHIESVQTTLAPYLLAYLVIKFMIFSPKEISILKEEV